MVAIDAIIGFDRMKRTKTRKSLRARIVRSIRSNVVEQVTPQGNTDTSFSLSASSFIINGNYMGFELYQAATMNGVDVLASTIELIARETGLAFSDVVEQVTPQGNTLLHLAACHGCTGNVRLILSHSSSIFLKQNIAGDTALHLAAKAGHGEVVKALTRFNENWVQPGTSEEWIASVRAMYEDKALLRVQNRKGNTALHDAVMKQHVWAVRLLMSEAPETLYLLNNEGKSPVYLAVEAWEEPDISSMLHQMKSGTKEEKLKGKSLLIAAISRRNTALLDKITQTERAFLNLRDEAGQTPLHHAAAKGYEDMVQYFLNKDASCALERDNNGFFPIHMAAAHGHVPVIQKLLPYCLDPREILSHRGHNIIHVTAARGKNHVIRFILQTPILDKLLNDGDLEGNTPLHLATINWHPKVVSTMAWDKRVDLGAVNNKGLTALDAAECYMDTSASYDKVVAVLATCLGRCDNRMLNFHHHYFAAISFSFLVARLTWSALKVAGAPRTHRSEILKINETTSGEQSASNMKNYKDRVNTLLLVATLVATVTFAAGFTMPGGYNQSDPNQGMATFLHKKAFYIFVFSDTIAMYSSILVAISLIWAQLGDLNLVITALQLAIPLLGVALAMMSLAFMAGVYLVVSKLHWLAYAVLIADSACLVALIVLFFPLSSPLSSTNCFLRYFSYYPLRLLIFVTVKGKDEVDR